MVGYETKPFANFIKEYDPDFIKGYEDAIKDVVSGKIDPKDWLAKHSKH